MDLALVGLRIKRCRNELNLTQEQFAEMLDVSPHYVYEIERGNKAMSLYTLNAVAACLNRSVDYILYGNSGSASLTQSSIDRLELLMEAIPYNKRDAVADILEVMLPYLKP